jgi:hypothetical protein
MKPETVQIDVVEEKSETASPDEAVGETVCVPPSVIAAGVAKVIVWEVLARALTVKLRVSRSPLKVVFPSWLASTRHVPADSAEMTKPETVHTEVVLEVSETASPEVVVGETVCVPPTFIAAGVAKVIVWAVFGTALILIALITRAAAV